MPSSNDQPRFRLPKFIIVNFITIVRIPLFMVALHKIKAYAHVDETLHAFYVKLGIFALALDYVDGALARWWKVQSKFGAFMDPLSDKSVNFMMFICLAMLGILHWIVVGIIIFRDFIVMGFRIKAIRSSGIQMETSKGGKFRQNYLGFAGVLLYWGHYWGLQVPFITTVAALILIILNRVMWPNKLVFIGLNKWHEKMIVVGTMILTCLYPPITIQLGIVILTLYTLCDYYLKLRIAINGENKQPRKETTSHGVARIATEHGET